MFSTVCEIKGTINMISVEFNNNSSKSLYVQLYEYLRNEISDGRIRPGERLPSLRNLAADLGISVTTVKTAYDQLMVEGYVTSMPQSGFYVAPGVAGSTDPAVSSSESDIPQDLGNSPRKKAENNIRDAESADEPGGQSVPVKSLSCDPESFDFVKWKKCMAGVLNETPELLLTEADRQGEPELRKEIAAYIYKSRGVICTQEQVVISAGTQQLVSHLARILKLMDIGHVSVEDPGYIPVRSIFRDWGFSMSCVPVRENGIQIERLPVNIKTAAYVCPQNQFPTGALMPVGRRHQLLDWAKANDSIIIEDDYNSELRYTGMPVPALQGLDREGRVVYIGSFTSTLFPAIRISYMVLPPMMVGLYNSIRMKYDQTCSKTEQLTLARFMQSGCYQANLRRVKTLYSRKLSEALSAIREYGSSGNFLTAENTQSGISLTLRLDTFNRVLHEGMQGSDRSEDIRRELADRLVRKATEEGIKVIDIDQLDHDGQIYLAFYYSQIPLKKIREAVRIMTEGFRSAVTKGILSMPSVYEVIRLTDGEPKFLEDHYERLGRSLAAIGMLTPFTIDELRGSIEDLVQESRIRDHNIRIDVDVSGYASMHLNPTHYPGAEMYRTGVKTGLFKGERANPNIKMMDPKLREATDATIKKDGLYEVLLVDREGLITEGSRSNVFFIKNGEVFTAPSDKVLLGVTRAKIIELIRDMGTVLHEESVAADNIDEYDAAFLSGTSPAVLPIARIGNVKYDVDESLLREIMKKYDLL